MRGHGSYSGARSGEESATRWTLGLFAVFGLVWVAGMIAWSLMHQGMA